MHKNIINFLENDLKWNINSVHSIETIGGLNNENYKVHYLNDHYFVRLCTAYAFKLDRKKEFEIMSLAQALNLCPKSYYASETTGNMVCEWIDGTMPSEEFFSSDKFISMLTPKLKLLHSLKIDKIFNPFIEIKEMLSYCESLNINLPSYIDSLLETLNYVQNYLLNDLSIGLCHNDPNVSNIILSKDNLFLIDYEFAGMGDIFFDLATLAWMMTPEGIDILLGTYFHHPTNYHYKKLSYYLFVVKLWNAFWSLLKSQEYKNGYDYSSGAYLIFEELKTQKFY
jgi:thiamine kinase-like enzyme